MPEPILAVVEPDRTPLAELLQNRAWRRRTTPFPHVVAQDVFTHATYLDLVVAFQEALDAGAFTHNMRDYDASGLTFTPALSAPFDIFVSRRWHDLMCGLFDVRGTGQMSGGLHHHEPMSGAGGIHNDLNPGHFSRSASPDEVIVADASYCDYGTGRSVVPGADPVRAIRAVAMIYYLGNPHWEPGDGGETGLYRATTSDVTRPLVAVPPHNNSLVMFECTPFSFHAFARGGRHARNSIVLWVHRTPSEVDRLWGSSLVVPW